MSSSERLERLEPEDIGPDTVQILTPEYITASWGIAESLVKEALSKGALRCRVIGRTRLVEYADVIAWIRTFPFKELNS